MIRIKEKNDIQGENSDWTKYENYISDKINSTLRLDYASPENVFIEVWNEPESHFWPYTGQYAFPDHYYDTWEHAYNVIKSINSDLKVVGPSFSALASSIMQPFLYEAQSRNVLPDFVSFHYPRMDVYQDCQTLNNFMNDNGINVGGIIIGEYLGAGHRKEGDSAYFIAQMERTKTENTQIVHSYLDPYESNGVLDGLALWGSPRGVGGDPRGAWWIYKKYAEMDGNYTLGTIKGLVGIHIYSLTPNLHYDYNIFRLKSNGDDSVGAPENVYGTVVAADSEGKLYLEIDWQDPTDCYYIIIL
jgi:hypothetical protein